MEEGITDDAASTYVFGLKLELRFDEDEGVASFRHDAESCGKDFCEGDKRDVGDDEINGFADVFRGHVAGVELFFDDDSGVVAKFPDELVCSYVNGMNFGCSVLEEAVGEASCR